ncbi:MAG: M36 family metallopeptidase [Acidobacteriota bacterium]
MAVARPRRFRTFFSALLATLLVSAGPALAEGALSPGLMAGERVVEVPSELSTSERAQRILEEHLSEQVYPLPLGTSLRVTGERVLPSGPTQVSLKTEVAGVPVFRGEHAVFFDESGELLALRRGAVADPGEPGLFVLTPEQAVALACARLNGELSQLDPDAFRPGHRLEQARRGQRQGEWIEVSWPGLTQPGWARPVIDPRGPRAAWQVHLAERERPDQLWYLLVDAVVGDVYWMHLATQHASLRGKVWPRGYLHPPEVVDFVDGRIVQSMASPEGWVHVDSGWEYPDDNPEGLIRSEGNNVYVWDDRPGDSAGTWGQYAYPSDDGEGGLIFDFTPTGDPANEEDLNAALTNAFWATNYAHDRFHALGFDEASGACQDQNFGRGGRGRDNTRVSVQFRSQDAMGDLTVPFTTNVSVSLGDGAYNQLLLGLWETPSDELRDSALDTGIIFHEYAHIVTLRMLGASNACDDGVQAEALHEGWADYFSRSFTGERILGGWVSDDPVNGIRTRPIGEAPYTLTNLCNISTTTCRRNDNGEIFSAMLWDLRQALIAVHGPEAGAERADRLIVEGLRYTACPPTFVDARDGILMADVVLNGGVDRCTIWGAFAGRGVGRSTITSGPADQYPFAGFDVTPECIGTSGLVFARDEYGDDADAELIYSDAVAPTVDRTITVRAEPSGDEEQLVIPGGSFSRRAVLAIRPGAPSAGDGILQVVDGDELVATCPDCPGAPEGRADIQRDLEIASVFYDLTNETCDADVNNLFRLLPHLDAGEFANLNVTLLNVKDYELEDVWIEVTDDHPNVHLLPHSPIQWGTVPAKIGTGYPFVPRLRVYAEDTVTYGEVVNFDFRVTARGQEGSLRVTVPLAADYEEATAAEAWGGMETFETDSPSVAGWTHQPMNGRTADQWGLQDCGEGGGRSMSYAGPGCTDYSDDPLASAILVSPPVFDPSWIAVEPRAIRWRNDVDLARDEFARYCDSEMVTLYLTDDLDRPDYEDPRNDRGGSVQYWVQWTGLGNDRNTGGWVDATPQQTINSSDIVGMDIDEVRLVWGFFTDVYNPINNGGCREGDPDYVARGYHLDDVVLEYEAVRRVPQDPATVCSDPPTCFVRTQLIVTPDQGLQCPGDEILLDATNSQAWNCPGGVLEYRFTGPGGFNSGYQASPTMVAPAGSGAAWAVTARCVDNTSCGQSVSLTVGTWDDSQGGAVTADSLRVQRSGDDVVLAYDGTRSPPTFAIYGAAIPTDDPDARAQAFTDLASELPPGSQRVGSADGYTFRDRHAARDGVRLQAYRVFGRSPCSGEVRP